MHSQPPIDPDKAPNPFKDQPYVSSSSDPESNRNKFWNRVISSLLLLAYFIVTWCERDLGRAISRTMLPGFMAVLIWFPDFFTGRFDYLGRAPAVFVQWVGWFWVLLFIARGLFILFS